MAASTPEDSEPGGAERAAREMAPLDALLLRADAEPRQRSVVIGLCLLDELPQWDALIDTIERTSRAVPRLRQRVVAPLLPVGRPRWVVDRDFDLTYHLRGVRVPAPGTFSQALEFVATTSVAPLDPARALWEATLLEGLPDGSAALVWKMSHALSDGTGAVRLARAFFDFEPSPAPRPLPPLPKTSEIFPRPLTVERLLALPGGAAVEAVKAAWWAVGAATRLATQPEATVVAAGRYSGSLAHLLAPSLSPTSSALHPRGVQRRLLTLEVGLDDLKRAGKAAGGTVNDAYLAGVLGALRRYHEAMGSPVESVPMAIPVFRGTSGGSASGNQFIPRGSTDR